ncbi:MAG TPA: hypothetical protein VI542_28325 [Candidatus Tectomicrobia bacterium]
MAPVSRSELQKLLPVVFALHPNRHVAECVLLDLGDHFDVLQRLEIQRETMRDRRSSESYYRPAATRRTLLQKAAYLASQVWECNQEGAMPTRPPMYCPTAADLLVRYIKTLAWWAMERRVHYAVTAIGCSLYTYMPHEMGYLVHWAAPNSRRYHGDTLKRLQARFPDLPLTTVRQHKQVDLRSPAPEERALVAQALACFAPWTGHLDRQPHVSLWESHFAAKATSDREGWEQIHAVLDPQCAGFHRLICDYNSAFGATSSMRLTPPDTKLEVPRLTPASSSGTSPHAAERFQPPALSEDDLARLEYILSHRRELRQRMRPMRLSVYVDGREVLHLPSQEMVDRVLTVPAYSSYLQVYGHDAEGPLLLAVFPLPEEDQALVGGKQSLVVTPAVGQTITLTIQSFRTAMGDLEQYRLQLTYDGAYAREGETPEVAGPSLSERLVGVVRWLSPVWPVPGAGELATAAAAAAQTHTFYHTEGEIRVTCEWRAAVADQPATLRIAWQASLTRPGALRLQVTQHDDPAVLLTELALGSALEGQRVWSARALGFDPSRVPWALRLVVTEPEA